MKLFIQFIFIILLLTISSCKKENYHDNLEYDGKNGTGDFRDKFTGIYEVKCESGIFDGKGYIRILKGYDENSMYIINVYEYTNLLLGLKSTEDGVPAKIVVDENDSLFTIETTYFPGHSVAAWGGGGYFKDNYLIYSYRSGKPSDSHSKKCNCEGGKTLSISNP